ncbi:unnamed protein product [Laminaria digitata]
MPGLSWKPKLSISRDGDMVALRPDGSQIILAGATQEGKSRTGALCGAERLLRRVAHITAPEHGARSEQGRLFLGREYFCSVDASPATVSTVDVAQLWLKGGGVLAFSDDGDVEMVGPSGELVWSLAQDQGGEKVKKTGIVTRKERHELEKAKRAQNANRLVKVEEAKLKRAEIESNEREHKRLRKEREDEALKGAEEKKKDARRKQLEQKEQDKRKRAEEFKRRQKERREAKKKRREEAKQERKARRKRLFGWNDDAAGDATANDNVSSAPSQGTPPGNSVFVRVLSWARPSPKGAGGHSG